MIIFEPFDVVAAPFPYVERPIRKRRPCLVVGEPEGSGLVWVVMTTSAKNAGRTGDVKIQDLGESGLKVPSVIGNAKIATAKSSELKTIGALDDETKNTVRIQLIQNWKVK